MSKRLACVLVGVILLFPLPFAAGSFVPQGRTLTSIFVILGGLAWLVWRWLQSGDFSLPRMALPLLAFMLWSAILLGRSPVFYYGFDRFEIGLILVLSFLILAGFTREGVPQGTLENILLATSLALVSLDLLLALANQLRWGQVAGSFFSLPPFTVRQYGMFLGHPNLTAGYLNLIIPILLVRVVAARNWKRRLSWLALMGPYLYMHYATSSRAGWLSLFAALVGMLLLANARRLGRLLHAGSRVLSARNLAIAGALLLAALVMAPLLLRQLQRGGHGTLEARLDIWKFALANISASPILGKGPASADFYYTQRPEWITVDEIFHTHNLLLQVLFTTGLVGLLLMSWAKFRLWRAYHAAWSMAGEGSPERHSLIAYAGVGIAVLAQGILDYLFWQPLYAMAVLYLVLLVYKLAPPQEWISIRKHISLISGAALLAICAAGSLYIGRGTSALAAGLSAANTGDWEAASASLCQSARECPGATYLRFQCSLSLAYLSLEQDQVQNLKLAVDELQLGTGEDPFWYVHNFNLASYEWQLGDEMAALTHMRLASQAAPRRVQTWLSLGWMEEQAGQVEPARQHYLTAVCRNPGYRESPFFSRNPFRQSVLEMSCPPEVDTLSTDTYTRQLRQAVAVLENGELGSAETLFKQASTLLPQEPTPHAYLGWIYQLSGKPQEAWREVQIAQFIGNNSAGSFLLASRVARGQARDVEAQELLWRAFEFLSKPNYSKNFYSFTYRLWGLDTDLSPYHVKTGLAQQTIDDLSWLQRTLAEANEVEKARQVETWLLRNSESW